MTVPVTYPPEDVPNGELLSGLPLPDIRGTMGTFSYFATDLSRYEEGNTEFGGILKRLAFEGNTASPELDGPPNPIVRQQMLEIRRRPQLSAEDKAELEELGKRADVRVPFKVEWTRGSDSADHRRPGPAVHAEGAGVEQVDRPLLPGERVHPTEGNGAVLPREGGRRPAAVHVAGELAARRPAHADLRARHVLADAREGAGPLPHARMGRGDVAARRGPHRRTGVHGRHLSRVRRPRQRHPEPDRGGQLGPVGRRHRVHRPRRAHDVAAHRSQAPDVRRGARGEVRRLDRQHLPQQRPVRRRGDRTRRSQRARSWWCRITGSTRSGRPSTSIPGWSRKDSWC